MSGHPFFSAKSIKMKTKDIKMKASLTLITALLLGPLAGLHAAESSGPTIFRVLDTVHPGEAVLLYGDWSVNRRAQESSQRSRALVAVSDHVAG